MARTGADQVFCKVCGHLPCLKLGTVVSQEQPVTWHTPASGDPSMTACGIPMPNQVKGSGLPICLRCLCRDVEPLVAEAERYRVRRELHADPKLKLRKRNAKPK